MNTPDSPKPARHAPHSLTEFMAQAYAMEVEAVERYTEFAEPGGGTQGSIDRLDAPGRFRMPGPDVVFGTVGMRQVRDA